MEKTELIPQLKHELKAAFGPANGIRTFANEIKAKLASIAKPGPEKIRAEIGDAVEAGKRGFWAGFRHKPEGIDLSWLKVDSRPIQAPYPRHLNLMSWNTFAGPNGEKIDLLTDGFGVWGLWEPMRFLNRRVAVLGCLTEDGEGYEGLLASYGGSDGGLAQNQELHLGRFTLPTKPQRAWAQASGLRVDLGERTLYGFRHCGRDPSSKHYEVSIDRRT